MENIVDILASLGQKVDPIMIKYLRKGTCAVFISPIVYQVKAGGKRVRSALTLLSCEAAGGKMSKALLPAAIIELIHNYSLIMDDVIDRGEIRRGIPTVRAKFGDDMALLVGMFYREVIGDIVNNCINSGRIQKLAIHAIKETIEGERLDMLFEQEGRAGEYMNQYRFKTVSNESYLKLISKKTAALMGTACQAGAVAAEVPFKKEKALTDYGWDIGLAFQITDDILDIFGEKTGKQKGKDIIEHKLGNAIIMFTFQEMESASKEKFLKILRKPVVDDDSVGRAIELIEETNAKDRAYDSARIYTEKGKKALSILPESEARRRLVELADFIVNRLY